MTTPSAANTALAEELPDVLSGHYSTPDGREMLARYVGLTREQLSGADRTDTEIAFMCGMASGADIESTTTLHLAKDRIRWLSAQVALQSKDDSAALEIARLRTAQYAFELWARLAFLWGDKPARAGEVDQYRVAYHKWLAALQTDGGKL